MKRYFLTLAVTVSLGVAGCGPQRESQTTAQNETAQNESKLPNDSSPTKPAADEPASQEKQDARAVLLAATVKAKTEDKRVLVHLGAPW